MHQAALRVGGHKKGDPEAAHLLPLRVLVAFAAEGHQQAEQIDEDVIDVQIQSHRRHHIVGFAAVDDLADVIQDVGGENQYGNRGDGQAERGDGEEEVRQGRDYQQDDADEQEFSHEAEILLGHGGVACQTEENQPCAARRHADQLRAVFQV